MARMTQLLVVRHGETDWNREGRWQGHGGPGLNDLGRRQAQAIAARLSRLTFAALYTSDLGRARETAEIIAPAVRRDPVLESGLREVDIGDWRGLTRAQVRERSPDGYRRWLRGEPGWTGGETYDEMHERVIATVQRLLAAHPSGRVLIVSHGGAVRAVVAHAAGLPRHDRRHINGAANCSLTTVATARRTLRLIGFNDIGHLIGERGLC
jgi:2,3-bisphosphoglycerate-dependent phosphoglycerate mutase